MAIRRSIRRKPKAKTRMAGKVFTKRRAKEHQLPPILEIKNVHRTYTNAAVPVRALRGIDLTVERGDMLAIMGPSGSGKTTLLNIIGLLDTPDKGTVLYAGQDLSGLKRRQIPRFRQKEVGMVFQQKNLIPTLTAYENVFLPFRYSRGKRAIKQEQANEALRLVGLSDRAEHMPGQLSGGEQQRVAIARALVLSPTVVIADEPTGELDSKTGHEVVALMQKLNQQTGQTFAVVTHNQMVADACHHVVHMQDGQIVESRKNRRRKK